MRANNPDTVISLTAMFLIEDIMLAKQVATEFQNDPVEEALAYHGGDARATTRRCLKT